MSNSRRDPTRRLFYGFASSLVIGALLFLLTGIFSVRDSRRILAAAEQGKNPERETAATEETLPKEIETTGETREEESEEETPESEGVTETAPEGSEETPAETEISYSDGSVHALSAEQIAEIERTVDTSLRGFGTGFTEPKDGNNRPVYVSSVEEELRAAGINVRCYCAGPEEKKAAITFQAGYEGGYTREVLEILARENVRSVFYITHEFGWNNPDLVREIIAAGHEIGNHSYSAPEEGIALQSLTAQMEDAIRMQTYMRETFGYEMHKYNYNSGVFSNASARMMSDMGYEVAFCSVNYDDFNPDAEFDANEILSSLLSCESNGCVYCFHMTNKVTVEILPGLINYLKTAGYEIVPMP